MMINVVHELNECVRSIGGEVLDDVLPGKRDYKNADYRFASDSVIAELKTVDTEVAKDVRWFDHAEPLLNKWIADGRLPRTAFKPVGNGLAEFNIGNLPEDCRFELLAGVRDRVFGEIFKSASKQIRETRDRLGPPDAQGLLLLCVDADAGLSLRVIQHVAGELMMRHGSRNRGVESMVIFSANFGIGLPGQPLVRPWMFLTGADRAPVDVRFVRKLGIAWESRIAALGGASVLMTGDGTYSILDKLLDQNLQRI